VQLKPAGKPDLLVALGCLRVRVREFYSPHGVALGFDDRPYSVRDLLSAVHDSSITTQVDAHVGRSTQPSTRAMSASNARVRFPVKKREVIVVADHSPVRSSNWHR
jgi:hypothetical protein